jgi:hypothetical protein
MAPYKILSKEPHKHFRASCSPAHHQHHPASKAIAVTGATLAVQADSPEQVAEHARPRQVGLIPARKGMDGIFG